MMGLRFAYVGLTSIISTDTLTLSNSGLSGWDLDSMIVLIMRSET